MQKHPPSRFGRFGFLATRGVDRKTAHFPSGTFFTHTAQEQSMREDVAFSFPRQGITLKIRNSAENEARTRGRFVLAQAMTQAALDTRIPKMKANAWNAAFPDLRRFIEEQVCYQARKGHHQFWIRPQDMPATTEQEQRRIYARMVELIREEHIREDEIFKYVPVYRLNRSRK